MKGVRKHVILLGKIFLDVSKNHLHSFVLLPGSLDLVKSYWSLVVTHGEILASSAPIVSSVNEKNKNEEDKGNEEFREKVALHGMLLFWGCLKAVYHPTPTYRCILLP